MTAIKKTIGYPQHVCSSDIHSDVTMLIAENNLKPEYRDILLFAIDYKTKTIDELGSDASLDPVKRHALERSMMSLISAGQAGKISPERLKEMVISSSRKDRSHRNWKRDADLEQRTGLLVGASNPSKVR